MQSTLQAALVTAGGADLSGQQTRLYRRRKRGGQLSPYQHQWLNALTPNQGTMLEKMVHDRDEADREMRRARRNGVTVIDGGQVLPPIVSTSHRPQARRRGAGRPRATASRSSARSGDSGDDGGSSDDGDAWPGGFSFRAYDELISTALPGHVRARLFHALPERWQREAWDRESAALERQVKS
jgi:hypothetical protein